MTTFPHGPGAPGRASRRLVIDGYDGPPYSRRAYESFRASALQSARASARAVTGATAGLSKTRLEHLPWKSCCT